MLLYCTDMAFYFCYGLISDCHLNTREKLLMNQPSREVVDEPTRWVINNLRILVVLRSTHSPLLLAMVLQVNYDEEKACYTVAIQQQ